MFAMARPAYPKENHLLAALPEADWQRWQPQLEWVDMPLAQVLYETGSLLTHVYFPTSASVSLTCVTDDGKSVEVAVVGNEGLVGISVFMGGNWTVGRAVVQSAGKGVRLKAEVLKDGFSQAPRVQDLLLRYTQALIAQITQTVACSRHHSLGQQLCRWLLLALDRLRGNELETTPELIADLIGGTREGVKEEVRILQAAELIDCGARRISVLDREGLERRVCECYAVVKKEYNRLLPDQRQHRRRDSDH